MRTTRYDLRGIEAKGNELYDNFSVENLIGIDRQILFAYEHQIRVKVVDEAKPDEISRSGLIGLSKGSKPQFILMLSNRSKSWYWIYQTHCVRSFKAASRHYMSVDN